MKRLVYKLLFAIALAAVPPATASAQSPEPPLITVTGEAQIRVAPDEVVVTLGVETSDKELGVSKAQNDERVRRLLGLAREFQVEPRHFQTDHISVEPWHRQGPEQPETREFRVRKTVVVTLREVAKFEGLLARALEVGATHVHGVQFRTTEVRKHRDAARALAIRAAREKALALASELAQKVGRAHRVFESGGGWYSDYGLGWGSRWGGGLTQNVSQVVGGSAAPIDGTIALGQITVTAHVSVSFLLE